MQKVDAQIAQLLLRQMQREPEGRRISGVRLVLLLLVGDDEALIEKR